MRLRATTLISILAIVPLGFGTATAQEQHPNPNAVLDQWRKDSQQESIEAALRSAKQHAAAGEKDAAIADYRKALSLEPEHPDAIAGLKALGVDDTSVAAPLTLLPLDGSPGTGATNPSRPPATRGGGGSGGGGPFPGGLY